MNQDTWEAGEKYEHYVGRWSRPVANVFLEWLSPPPALSWLDVGCGTGALSRAILEECSPTSLHGIDPSAAFIDHARNMVHDPRAGFSEGGAESIPFQEESFDVVASGLVLNFVPNSRLGVSEMVRVARPGGTLAVYVWDYADKMELIRYFWDAAVELDPSARKLDEALRFPICNQEAICTLFEDAGLEQVETRNIDVPTKFENFDDYWTPFLGGQGPAPGYAMGLDSSPRDGLRDLLRRRLPAKSNGSISLMARALAVRGLRTQG